MLTVNKHKELLQKWFYLDEDGNTVKRCKDGYRGRYKKNDTVIPYKLCSHGYQGVHIPTTRTTVPFHHLITLLRGIEIPDGFVIDHIDGNTLNNKASNIRVVTQQINCRNTRKQKSNTLGITGISWNKASNSFVVRKCMNGKRVYLGMRSTLIEAEKLLDSHTKSIIDAGYTVRHGK